LGVGRCVGAPRWTKTNSQAIVRNDMNLHNQEEKAINASEWKWCGEFSRDNSSTNFTQLATFGRRHHSPPCNILCASLWELHPNVTFPQYSQMGVPKLRFLLFQNFGHLYFPQLNFFLKFSRPYFIAFENIFPMV
jgi:hypothetical protein